ncbi:MAG: hypothetical protein E7B29_17930, partial [Mixta calida]|nr:hypothetical protein [Mixta calida]
RKPHKSCGTRRNMEPVDFSVYVDDDSLVIYSQDTEVSIHKADVPELVRQIVENVRRFGAE